jgi:protoporphyrinogen oxidase
MRVAVIGAGPAGMTAALQLSGGGVEVDVYEAGEHVGGMARSFDLWGQRVDLGPHRFFSTDTRVNQLWFDVVGQDHAMVDRLTRIYYGGRFYRYPLKPLNAFWSMGPAEAVRCLASYVKERVRPSLSNAEEVSFESWVVGRFGRRLFDRFFKSYSEKLWDIPCSELSADFAAQRIRKLSLLEAARSALSPQRRRQHKTLVDHFSYPLGGTGSVYETMADQVRENGGRIHLRCPVQRILCGGCDVRGIELRSGDTAYYDHVISTMPLTSLIHGLADVPADVQAAAEALRFRNTILVYLHVDSDSLFRDQWLYVHDPSLKMGRVTNFRNWVPELYGDAKTTVLAVEYWCNDSDSIWTAPDERLIEQATRELRSSSLLRDEPVLDGHVIRIKRCYPVYRRGYGEHVERLADYLRGIRGLTPIGRYGTFKYNNQDHSILMGILAAENLLDGRGHDLWHVNTDHETYQEGELVMDACLSAAQEGGEGELVFAGQATSD